MELYHCFPVDMGQLASVGLKGLVAFITTKYNGLCGLLVEVGRSPMFPRGLFVGYRGSKDASAATRLFHKSTSILVSWSTLCGGL